MQNLDLKGNGRIDFHEFMTYILFMKYDIGKYTSHQVKFEKNSLEFLPLYYLLNEEILSRKNSNIKHILNFPAGFLKFPLFSTCEQENTAELMHVYIPSAISKIFLAVYITYYLDKDGFITLTEYKNIESELYGDTESDSDLFGEKSNEEEAKEFIATTDIDGDGKKIILFF